MYQNGDFVDQGGRTKPQSLTDLATIEAIYQTASAPRYYAFGNHELETLTKEEFISNTGMSQGYYHFDIKNVRFIVLDPCFRSDSDSDQYSAGNYTWTTSYVPPTERAWLTSRLSEWTGQVVILCHYNLVGTTYAVTNASAVRSILEASGKVIGVFSGHAHTNAFSTVAGIPYYTMQAATENEYPQDAYAIIEVRGPTVKVLGFKNQVSY